MKKTVLISILIGSAAASLFADVALTDKAAAIRFIAHTKDSKRQRKTARSGRIGALSLHPAANATGSFQLIDAGGLKYFINTNITFSTSSSASGAASEANYTAPVAATTLNGGTVMSALNDSYDGYNSICVSLTGATGTCQTGNAAWTIYNKNGPPSVEGNGRQIDFPAKTIGSLSVSRKVFVPSNDRFIRWENIIKNNGATPVTFVLATGNNLGSDANTVIVNSSNGDAVAQTTDLWVTTFQNFVGAATTTSDPRLGHIFQGAGAPVGVSNIFFANGNDKPWWDYTITLQPGQTGIILNYGVAMQSKAAAASQAAAVAAWGPNERQFMSTQELSEVLNFAVADLSIAKTSSPTTNANAGQAIAYTLSVTNNGPATATNVSVTDTLPAGETFVSASGTGWTCGQSAGTVTCTMASLAAGPANPIAINAVAPVTAATLSNTANVTSSTFDENTANNSSTNTLNVIPIADLSLTKSAPANVAGGAAFSYTINVGNAGPSIATAVSVSDTLPAGETFGSASGSGWTCGQAGGVVTCTQATLGIGSANPITIGVTGPSTPGVITNTATVSSATTDPNPANNSGSASSSVTSADLSISKTAQTTLAYGALPVSYTLAVTNNGPGSASNVSVTDTLPPGAAFVSASGSGWTCGAAGNVVTCTMPSLAVGPAAPIALTITAPAVTTAGTLSNTASVSAATGDPNPGNNSGTSTVPIQPGSAIPAMNGWGLTLLLAALTFAGAVAIRRH